MKASIRVRCLAVALMAWLVGGVALASPSPDEIAALFPAPAQVAADYPDDAQQYVALNTLWDFLHEKAPASQNARDKRSAYYNASTAIQSRYVTMPAAQGQAFVDRMTELTRDRKFKRSVIEKYHLAGLATAPASATNPQALVTEMRPAVITDAVIQNQFWKALPILVGTFFLMWLVAKMLLPFSVGSPTVESPPTPPYPGLPQLPEALRVIKVPGVTYTVEFVPALVVDKESVIHRIHTTTTTPGQPYQLGNEVHFTPITTSTSTSSTKVDTVWVRTPYQRETSWTLTNQNFKTRPGHIISTISRRLPSGQGEMILLCNHTTGELERIPHSAHATKSRYAMLLAFLIGSIGIATWIGFILSIDTPDPDPLNRLLHPVVYWLMAIIPAAVITFIVVVLVQKKIQRRRNARFESQYFPGLQQFLMQATPQLERYFAG